MNCELAGAGDARCGGAQLGRHLVAAQARACTSASSRCSRWRSASRSAWFAGEHVEAINPIGRIYINVLLATVGPLILVAIVSSIISLGEPREAAQHRPALDLLAAAEQRARRRARARPRLRVPARQGHPPRARRGSPTDTIQGQVQSFSQVVVGFFPTNVVAGLQRQRHHPDHPDRGHALDGLPVAGREGAREGPAVPRRRRGAQARHLQGRRLRHPAHAVRDRRAHGAHGRQQHEPRQRASGRCSGCWRSSGSRASCTPTSSTA